MSRPASRTRMAVAGVDVGATASKAVIMVDGQLRASSQCATRNAQESALQAMNAAMTKAGLNQRDVSCIVATGRGRAQVSFAHKTVTEIACAAAGALHVWGPTVRTVLDAGGESCRVVHCTETGRPTSFLWNDKCAAGIGRSIETLASLVEKEVTELADIALRTDRFPQLSDFCAVYAQSEALDLVRTKVPVPELIAGYHYAMARRISTLVARAAIKSDFVIIGGLARNAALVRHVETLLKANRLAPKPEWDPGLTVALGAAVYAGGLNRKAT